MLWLYVQTVYAVSISGVVYCIIRTPAWYNTDQRSGQPFVFDGRQGQTVVEGLVVGGLNLAAAGGIILAYKAMTSRRPYYSLMCVSLTLPFRVVDLWTCSCRPPALPSPAVPWWSIVAAW